MVSVVLLMAGKGQRMKKDINKVLLEVENKPLFTYPLNTFLSYNFEIILIVSKKILIMFQI